MSKKQDFLDAVNMKEPKGAIPIWEIHFHLWDRMSNERFISGTEYLEIASQSKRDYVLKKNAEVIIDIADKLHFNAVSIPDAPWDCHYTLPSGDRLKLASLLREANPDFYVVANCSAYIGMPDNFDGYEEFCYMLYDAPEKIDDKAKKKFEAGMINLKKAADAGVEVVYAASDFADTRAPFFTKPQMERFVLPYMTEWVKECKQFDMTPIVHTDGNVTPLLNEITGTGAAVLQAIDPTAGMDMKTTKDTLEGKMCICGNVDTGLLVVGTSQQVYESTTRILKECKDGCGIVLGASNAVVMETPIENYLAMIKAWEDFGQY